MLSKEQLDAIAKIDSATEELSKKLHDTPLGEKEVARALMARIDELADQRMRAMQLSKAEIADINRRSASEVEALIQGEVKAGVTLFEEVLRGDTVAITQIKKGSHEFAVAVGEGAISEADLEKLPLATAALSAIKH